MKKVFAGYAAYNLWANQRLVDAVLNLSDAQLHQTVESSFDTVFKNFLHLWDVEHVWYQRMKLSEKQEWPSATFQGSIVELTKHLLEKSKQWKEWTDLATEAALEHEFIYRNTKRDQFKQPVHEVLHHVFNHQTFHRGQLITILRQLGIKDLPNTDLISFLRKK